MKVHFNIRGDGWLATSAEFQLEIIPRIGEQVRMPVNRKENFLVLVEIIVHEITKNEIAIWTRVAQHENVEQVELKLKKSSRWSTYGL